MFRRAYIIVLSVVTVGVLTWMLLPAPSPDATLVRQEQERIVPVCVSTDEGRCGHLPEAWGLVRSMRGVCVDRVVEVYPEDGVLVARCRIDGASVEGR